MQLHLAESLPWFVAFVAVLSLYIYVRGKRIARTKKSGRR